MRNLKSIFLIVSLTLSSFFVYGQATSGKASYYSNRLHGSRTSSGERYNKDSMTCAHKKFPFGTWLKVKNFRNNKEVFVRVNDRGPFIKGRIIDLSYAAAKKLNIIGHGVAKVEVTNMGETPDFSKENIINRECDILLDSTKKGVLLLCRPISAHPIYIKVDNVKVKTLPPLPPLPSGDNRRRKSKNVS